MHDLFKNEWIAFGILILLLCTCMFLFVNMCLCPKTVVVQTIKIEELPA